MTDSPHPPRVTDAAVGDLTSRLSSTRWPQPWPGDSPDGWARGTDEPELRRLVAYWAEGFDWRRAEQALHALPWHVADLNGTAVRYLRYDAESGVGLPIVLTHGWPSTVLELTTLAQRLSHPTSYGGRVEDAFTVIIPALPGFPCSPPPAQTAVEEPTHHLWHRLLHNELGFPRYAAHGGDLGAGITSLLGQDYPDAVLGIHLLAVADPIRYDPATLSPQEQAYQRESRDWFANEGAYEHQQMTRPATLAAALSDSPTGLLAWLLEKYRAWTDCGGVLATRFSDDFILTQVALYGFTNSISTSFRPYWNYQHGLTPRVRAVTVPTAVAVFPHDLTHPPRSWAERSYHVTRYTTMPRGGHFAAHEEPALLARDITSFYRSLR